MKKVLLILVSLLTTAMVWAKDPITIHMGENEQFEISAGVTQLLFTPEETDYYVFTAASTVAHGFCINLWTDSLYEIYSEPAPLPNLHGCNLGYPKKLVAGHTYKLGIFPLQTDVTAQTLVFVRKGYLVSTDAESEGLTHLLEPLPVAAYEGQEVQLNAMPGTVIDNLTATANGAPIDIEIGSSSSDGGSTFTSTLGKKGEERWYVADGTLNYNQTLILKGDVHIILANGAVMNIGTQAQPVSGLGIDGSYTQSSLTIYGQTLDDDIAGHLNINTDDDCIYNEGDYAQHSGNVTMNSSNGAGAVPYYNFTFTGGTLYIAVDKNAIYNGENVDILGGKLTAVSTGYYYGIYTLNGDVTLGWKNADDEITISNLTYGSGYCTMKIVDGQAFTDGENIYDSTTPSNVLWALTNVTLHPVVPTFAINLPESFENGMVTCDKATAAQGETVTLTVTPNNGYELETLTVTTVVDAPVDAPLRANVDLTEGENGTYTFAMPAAPVAVSASFKKSNPTGVNNLNIDKPKNAQRYNLMGQPVGNNYKGIVIQNGKKIIVK